MELISGALFLFAFLSFYSPIFSFLIFCAIAFFHKNFSSLNQIALSICIFNLFRELISDTSIYSDFIVYKKIPSEVDFFDISSYWAASYDYLFVLFIKILHLLDADFYFGFICLLTVYLLVLFNLVHNFRNSIHDAIFFLLCFSYTSSFQLTRYTLGATLAYILYIGRPSGLVAFLFSSILLLQVHFYSLLNYIIFRLNYKFIIFLGLLVLLVLILGMDNLFIYVFPEFGKYSGQFYSPSDDFKLLVYILLSSMIFLIKSPCKYMDPLKKMVALSILFFFINNTFSARMLVLPFNIFFGLIYSYIINQRSKLLYFIPFSLFFYRYLLL